MDACPLLERMQRYITRMQAVLCSFMRITDRSHLGFSEILVRMSLALTSKNIEMTVLEEGNNAYLNVER